MTEAHIGYLYKAASVFAQSEINESHKKLKSYYLMQCKEITRGYGLPKKHFSKMTRCSFCCLEWNNKSQTRLKPVKLSKRQRKRIKYNSKIKKPYDKECLLYSNKMEKICSLCGKSTKILVMKPNKSNENNAQKCNQNIVKDVVKSDKEKPKPEPHQPQLNVYSPTVVAFALNKNNTIPSTIPVQPKIIKNNKKRKDKFAGLCQQAVISAAKLKKEKDKKLNLFLKPSL